MFGNGVRVKDISYPTSSSVSDTPETSLRAKGASEFRLVTVLIARLSHRESYPRLHLLLPSRISIPGPDNGVPNNKSGGNDGSCAAFRKANSTRRFTCTVEAYRRPLEPEKKPFSHRPHRKKTCRLTNQMFVMNKTQTNSSGGHLIP